MAEKQTGKVNWFAVSKGIGFITPDGGGKQIVVHISAVEAAGLDRLEAGQEVAFSVKKSVGGMLFAFEIALLGHFDYLLYVDFDASMADPNAQNAQEFATFLRVLGSYPTDVTEA